MNKDLSVTILGTTITVGDVLINKACNSKWTVCFGEYRDYSIEKLDEKALDYDDIYYDEDVKGDCNYGFYVVGGRESEKPRTYALTKSTMHYCYKECSNA